MPINARPVSPAPRIWAVVGASPCRAEIANEVSGRTLMNSMPLSGVRILLPTFQLNTATKPAQKAMYARCGRTETTASAGGTGMSFDANSMVSMANMLTRLRPVVRVVYLRGDHFG